MDCNKKHKADKSLVCDGIEAYSIMASTTHDDIDVNIQSASAPAAVRFASRQASSNNVRNCTCIHVNFALLQSLVQEDPNDSRGLGHREVFSCTANNIGNRVSYVKSASP